MSSAPAYVRTRGDERADVLAVERRQFPLRGRGEGMAGLMNTAVDQAGDGLHSAAIDTLGEALSLFDGAVAAQPPGYNHLFPLQSGAAIALVRQAESWRALGRPDDALRCYELAYGFHIALEEQAGEEDWWARQWAAEAQLRRGDLLAELGRIDDAVAAWRTLLPSQAGFMWPSLMDWSDEAADRLR